MDFDPVLLARLQFAFTIIFHIIFPSFTIGLASFLAVLEGLWLATRNEAFKVLYLFCFVFRNSSIDFPHCRGIMLQTIPLFPLTAAGNTSK